MDSENLNEIQGASSASSCSGPGKLNFKKSSNIKSNSSSLNSNLTPKEMTGQSTSGSAENDEQAVYRQMSCTNTIKWSNVLKNDQLQYSLPDLPAEKLLIAKKRIKSKKSKSKILGSNQNLPQKISIDEEDMATEQDLEDDDIEAIDEKCEEISSSHSEKITYQEFEKDAVQNIVEDINLNWSKTPSPSFSTSQSVESTTEDSKNTSPSTDRMSHSDFEHKIQLFNSLNQSSSNKFKNYECPWAKSSFRSDKTTPQNSLRTPNSFIHQVMHGDFNVNLNKMPTSTQTEESANGSNSTNNRQPQSSASSFARPFQIPSSTQTPSSPPKISSDTQTTPSQQKLPSNKKSSNPTTESGNLNYNERLSGGSTTPCSYEKLNFNFSNSIKQNFIGNTELNYLGSGIVQASDDLFLESHYYLMINIPALDSVFTTMYLSDSQSESWRNDYQRNKNHYTDAAKNRIYELGNNLLRDKSSNSDREKVILQSYLSSNDTLKRQRNFENTATETPKPSSSKQADMKQREHKQTAENSVNWTNQYEEYEAHAIIIPEPEDEIIIVSESSLPNQALELSENISYKDCLKSQTKSDQHLLYAEKRYESIPVIESNYSSSPNSKSATGKTKKQNKKFMKSKTLSSAPISTRPSIFDKELNENWADISLDPEDAIDSTNIKIIESHENKSCRSNWFTRMFSKKKKSNVINVSETYFVKLPNPKKLTQKTELTSLESGLYSCGAYPL